MAKINFQEIEELFLDQNIIESVDALINMNCKNLKKLKFEKNNKNREQFDNIYEDCSSCP